MKTRLETVRIKQYNMKLQTKSEESIGLLPEHYVLKLDEKAIKNYN